MREATPAQIRSIAVLPLRNLSRDPDQEYFTDGMTEALTTGLAQISALSVIAQSSMTRYGGTKKPASEIARELQVDALVEGAVQRSGNRVMITAHLIDGSNDRQLWAKSFERDLRDVLALQGELAQAIAGEIGAKLTPQEQARLLNPRPVNPEAQEAYMWGLYWSQRKGGTEKALRYLQQATEKDPGYAPAYAALAGAYGGAVNFGLMPANEGTAKWNGAATKALDLDETLAEAHASLAGLLQNRDWKWNDAEKEFARAVQLNPNLADTHAGYAECLVRLGRMDQAVAEIRRKLQLDPYSPVGHHFLAQYLLRARRYDEAIERVRTTLEQSELAVKLNDADPFFRMISVGSLAHAYAAAGRMRQALRELTVLKQSLPAPDRAFQVALVYTALGDNDQAFEWLNNACHERSYFVTFIKTDPRMDSLRSDPRYSDLLRRMGLPE